MKKNAILLVIFSIFSLSIYSQAREEINFGLVGASYEIPVSENITIAPTAFTNFDVNYLTLGVKANYYLDSIFDLPKDWDVYGGANLGFGLGIGNGYSNGLDLGLQLGARWFWNEKWGVYLEAGGGKLAGASYGIGLTLKL